MAEETETGTEMEIEKKKLTELSMAEFLESHPPCSPAKVTDLHIRKPAIHELNRPELQLHCTSEICNGVRMFRAISNPGMVSEAGQHFFLDYRCRNCGEVEKTFALVGAPAAGNQGVLYKIGEFPPYGPPLPARVISLIGPDRDLFLRGRRCENQGLGVGAFAYYRRVVENQWHRLLAEVLRVAERVGKPQVVLDTIRRANSETQFSKAVDMVKEVLPEFLYMDGHNPLTLLHKALSEGLHDEAEEHCLSLAHSMRIILTELADRMSQALKDEAELKEAVSRLQNRRREGSS